MSGSGRFDGKVAVVTGAARGLGRAIALRLAQEGAAVAVNDLPRSERLDEVVAEIRKLGGKAVAVRADISNAKDVERLMAETVSAFGGLDILVNNAGIETETPVLELTDEEWDRIFAVNARGVFLCSRSAGRIMRDKGKGGKIVSVSSLCGQMAWVGCAHYCASKAAGDMLTKSLALELAGYGINVNAVAPGTILTEIANYLIEDTALQERLLSQTPSGRFGTPEDVAGAVAFLCSADADWIHGHILTVDGGFWLGWR